MTLAISCRDEASLRSVGTANGPVPSITNRMIYHGGTEDTEEYFS